MRIAAAAVAAVFLTTLGTLSASSDSVHPNPKASRLCVFGPGKARWDVKTSLAEGSDPSQTSEVGVGDLVYAPDLQVDPRTVAFARRQVALVRKTMHGANAMADARVEFAAGPPFVAHLRWAAPRSGTASRNHGIRSDSAAGAQPSFFLRLPAISPAVASRADAIARSVDSAEAPPSFFDTLLSAQLETVRLPEPVAVGNSQYHEGDMISVSGYVLKSTCERDDGDFHIDLGAKADADACAIVEVPNPAYVAPGPLRSMVAKAEATAKTLAPGDHVTVYGQLFYDATHNSAVKGPGGGRGVGYCAQSLWEVHPVVRIDVG